MADVNWHAEAREKVTAELRTDAIRGLSSSEVAARLEHDGPNAIRQAQQRSVVAIFVHQFFSLVIWVLIGAAAVSAALGERLDGVVIIAIVVLNAAIGFFQEYRAERAAAGLAKLTAPRARVIREGQPQNVPAAEIARGDLLMLSEGDLVAADARLVDATMLHTNEAALTGESLPVEKQALDLPADTMMADRTNMVFLGTSVVSGTGHALVVATGMTTELGRMAALIETASGGPTPLERQLDRVGWRLLWASLAIVALVFVLGLLRGVAPFEMFLGAVSLAVAAIPEGLPAVVTVALALGVQRMAGRNALVRHLHAVETLGCVQVICTDKTGTLTMGEMTVRRLVTMQGVFAITGEGYTTDGAILMDGAEAHPEAGEPLHELLLASAACNDSRLDSYSGRTSFVGDPTEAALLVAAAKANLRLGDIDTRMPRLGSVPFTSGRKRMTVVRRRDEHPWAFVKGAPEIVIQRCSRVRTAAGDEPLSDAGRATMLEASALMASDALRVLAFAQRPLESFSSSTIGNDEGAEIERELILLGLAGMQDPPRPEARDAIQKCKLAGIKTVMITGDHPGTAGAIGRELRIVEHGAEIMTGRELQALTDGELTERVEKISVYARVTAEHKLRIVRAWKARGAIVAMTGDGVNDAPALKEASVGVAMGRTGTEVTKQTADIIITDDNFASIVAAVEQGRGVYDNIVKTLTYLMGGNSGELAVMLFAAIAGMPLPLIPVQLLWINLVTDGLPALALATDAIEPGVLARPPRDPKFEIMDRRFFGQLALIGTLSAAVALTAFSWELHGGGTITSARNATFSVLVIEELMRSFSFRSGVRTIWEVGLLSNLRLFAAVAATFGLQIAIVYMPALQPIFGTASATSTQVMRWLVLGLIPLGILELRKVVRRERSTVNAI